TDYSRNSRIDGRKHLSLSFLGLRVGPPNNGGVGLIDAAIFVGGYSGLCRHATHDECVLTQFDRIVKTALRLFQTKRFKRSRKGAMLLQMVSFRFPDLLKIACRT